jgi:hypothetical protein
MGRFDFSRMPKGWTPKDALRERQADAKKREEASMQARVDRAVAEAKEAAELQRRMEAELATDKATAPKAGKGENFAEGIVTFEARL